VVAWPPGFTDPVSVAPVVVKLVAVPVVALGGPVVTFAVKVSWPPPVLPEALVATSWAQ
jgi:hypothetical protein